MMPMRDVHPSRTVINMSYFVEITNVTVTTAFNLNELMPRMTMHALNAVQRTVRVSSDVHHDVLKSNTQKMPCRANPQYPRGF